MRNYSIAGKRGQWPAPEDTSLFILSYLILSYL